MCDWKSLEHFCVLGQTNWHWEPRFIIQMDLKLMDFNLNVCVCVFFAKLRVLISLSPNRIRKTATQSIRFDGQWNNEIKNWMLKNLWPNRRRWNWKCSGSWNQPRLFDFDWSNRYTCKLSFGNLFVFGVRLWCVCADCK